MKAEDFRTEGWHSIDHRDMPPADKTVEWARDERVYRQPSWLGKWSDFHPEFNVAGLWWREP